MTRPPDETLEARLRIAVCDCDWITATDLDCAQCGETTRPSRESVLHWDDRHFHEACLLLRTLRENLDAAGTIAALRQQLAEAEELLDRVQDNGRTVREALQAGAVAESQVLTLAGEVARLRDGMSRLTMKLRAVHANEQYQSFCAMGWMHSPPYTGPHYAAELDAAEALLGGSAGQTTPP